MLGSQNSQRCLKTLTCYCLSMAPTFASGDEDDVALAGIDVVILQDEELLDTILLQCCNFDNCAYGTHEAAIQHYILLAANLCSSGQQVSSSGLMRWQELTPSRR